MFPILLDVGPFIRAITTPKSNTASIPMAPVYNVDTSCNGPMGPRRRSSSISPSDSPSQTQRPRTQNTLNSFAKHVHEHKQPVDSQVADGRRKSKIIDFLFHRRESDGCNKQVCDQEQSKYIATIDQNQQATDRRRSKFGSFSDAIKKGMDRIKRRNDSAQEDATPTTLITSIECDVGTQPLSGAVSRDEHQLRREEMQRYTADLEPFARDGMLRFYNMRHSQDDLLDSPSGPSTYYEDRRFKERGCSVQRHSPYRAHRKRGDSPKWVYEAPRFPTRATIAESGADPYQWQTLSGLSPGPTPKRKGFSQYPVRRLPNFLRPSGFGKRMKRRAVAIAPPHTNSRGPREVSCVPSVAESSVSTFSLSKPNIFRPVPNLNFTFSFDHQIGVLPTIDSASTNTNSDVSQARHGVVSSCSPAARMAPLRAVHSTRNTTNISTPSSSNQSSSRYVNSSYNPSLWAVQPSPSTSTIPTSTYYVDPYPCSIVPPSVSSLSPNPPSSPVLRPIIRDSIASKLALALPGLCIPPPKHPDTPPHPKPQTHPHAQRQRQAHAHVQYQQQTFAHTQPQQQSHGYTHPHAQENQHHRDPYPYPDSPLLVAAQDHNSHALNSENLYNLNHIYSTPNLLSGPQDHNAQSRLAFTSSPAMTATDTESDYSDLGLRRMNSLAGVLDNSSVDGELLACGALCCASRGRSRVRRGDALSMEEAAWRDQWYVLGDWDVPKGVPRDM